MTYAYIQVPTGVQAITPANNSLYTSPGGLTYIVRNPNFTPFYSLRFKPESTGLANGQSDVFRYVLPAQTKPDYIQVAARLLSGAYVEAHLNTFYCPVGTEPANKPAAEISERAAPATAAVLHVFPKMCIRDSRRPGGRSGCDSGYAPGCGRVPDRSRECPRFTGTMFCF